MKKFSIQELDDADGSPEIIALMETSSNQWKRINSIDVRSDDLQQIMTLFRATHTALSNLITLDRQGDTVYIYCTGVEINETVNYKLTIERSNEVSKLTLWKKDNPPPVTPPATPTRRTPTRITPRTPPVTPPRRRTPGRTPTRRTTPTSVARGVRNPCNLPLLRYLRNKHGETMKVECARVNRRAAAGGFSNDVLFNFKNVINVVKNSTLTITRDNFESFTYIGVKSRGHELTNIGQLVLDFFEAEN